MYNILVEFGIYLKLVRLINVCVNESYSRVWVGKYLSVMLLITNGLKQRDALSPLLFNFVVYYATGEGLGKPGGLEIKRYTSASSLC